MNKHLDIMVDLETLGTDDDAAIISIGAVVIELNEERLTGAEFYNVIDLDLTNDDEIGSISASTIIWWMQQSDQARKAFTNKTHSKSLGTTLLSFIDWLMNQSYQFDVSEKQIRIWGNGATFDNVILRNAFKRTKQRPPWPFWGDMCYRTMKNMYPNVKAASRQGTHHNAVDDARFQALHLIEIYKEMQRG